MPERTLTTVAAAPKDTISVCATCLARVPASVVEPEYLGIVTTTWREIGHAIIRALPRTEYSFT